MRVVLCSKMELMGSPIFHPAQHLETVTKIKTVKCLSGSPLDKYGHCLSGSPLDKCEHRTSEFSDLPANMKLY